MSPAIQALPASLADALRALARRPYLLAALLILINAAATPYMGIVHDAQIYTGLVLNRIDPDFLSSDLFFRYGSQDKYSLFSPMMAPFVALLGPKIPFFVGYLLSITLLFTALTRLVVKLWPDSPAAVVGLIFLALVRVPYGGHVPLHVIEPFLSARVPACALTLWAFTDILERRWGRGSLAMLFAFAIHPLMTLPGIMVLAVVFLARRWGAWGVAIPTAVAMVGFGALLATPSIATPLFGYFDPEWLELTQNTNCYMFVQEWFPQQWFWNLFALAVLATASVACRGEDDDRSRILAGAVMIGVAGFFGTWLFSYLPYALLNKGQAYRWLWFPLILTPPAVFHLALQSWQANRISSRLCAVALVAWLGITTYHWLEFLCLGCFLPVTYYAAIIFGKKAEPADRVGYSVAASVLLGLTLWGSFRIWNFFENCGALLGELTYINVYDIVIANLNAGILVPLTLLVLAVAGSWLATTRRVWPLLAGAVAVQAAFFAYMGSEAYRTQHPQYAELQYVEDFLKERRQEEGRSLAIYCNYGRLYQYWVEWGTRSYYDCFQLAGFVFNRETAVEGQRRAKIVGPFEAVSLAKGRSEVIPEGVKEKISAWLGADVDSPSPPTEEDLLRLAREDDVDYIVLFCTHFEHLAEGRRGDVSIYDARKLREVRVSHR